MKSTVCTYLYMHKYILSLAPTSWGTGSSPEPPQQAQGSNQHLVLTSLWLCSGTTPGEATEHRPEGPGRAPCCQASLHGQVLCRNEQPEVWEELSQPPTCQAAQGRNQTQETTWVMTGDVPSAGVRKRCQAAQTNATPPLTAPCPSGSAAGLAQEAEGEGGWLRASDKVRADRAALRTGWRRDLLARSLRERLGERHRHRHLRRAPHLRQEQNKVGLKPNKSLQPPGPGR